ncbi:MAG: hypothetical protein WD009_00875 [Phycisphaeraceae bacterium]
MMRTADVISLGSMLVVLVTLGYAAAVDATGSRQLYYTDELPAPMNAELDPVDEPAGPAMVATPGRYDSY